MVPNSKGTAVSSGKSFPPTPVSSHSVPSLGWPVLFLQCSFSARSLLQFLNLLLITLVIASCMHCHPWLFTGYACRHYTHDITSNLTGQLAGKCYNYKLTDNYTFICRPKKVKVIFPVTELGLRPGVSGPYRVSTGVQYMSRLVSFKWHFSLEMPVSIGNIAWNLISWDTLLVFQELLSLSNRSHP